MLRIEYAHPGTPSRRRLGAAFIGWSSACIGAGGAIVGSGYAALVLCPVPVGSAIRPMMPFVLLYLMSVGCLVVGMLLALVCAVMAKRRWRLWVLAATGAAMAFAPYVASWTTVDFIITSRGLILD